MSRVRQSAGRLGSACALSLALLCASQAVAQRALPAEAIAATVGGPTPAPGVDVVLLSDVVLRAELELAVARGPVPTELPTELLAATLEQIIGEILVAREAARLGTAAPSEADVVRERGRIVASVGGDAALAAVLSRQGASSAEIDAIALRRAQVASFFRANLEGTSEISDAQVEARYARGDHPFADRPLEEIRDALRAWMASEAVRADVRRWLEVLRGRTTVRVFLPSLEPSAPSEASPSGGKSVRPARS